jgi:hypothetical protein
MQRHHAQRNRNEFRRRPTPPVVQSLVAGAQVHPGAAVLLAVFVADERTSHLGLYTGARCELPTGEIVEVKGRRTPLYDLARELEKRGYGDCRLQAYTPTGTPSLRGLVKVMAGLTVEEGPCGLRRRKYRPAKGGEGAVDAREPSSRSRTPGNEETRVRESTAREEAA